ncbi:DUF924 family protein [Castellaniella sp.]|uniref:DUF924 family protein n=1 Tax=Castellaniella sp. TaxID=1955812 RepID=UPI002AFEAFCD|nr:DUF924 family protein [Castellaniella sp.]
MEYTAGRPAWQDILEFWFPEGRSLQIDATTHQENWRWRMQGGADSAITSRFLAITDQAAAGELDHWAAAPEGRLALIIVLDQFSRSAWRNSARAFAQDTAALAWVMEGLSNDHYAALPAPWFKAVYGLPLGHCEGPDHLDRLDLLIKLRTAIAAEAPPPLQATYQSLVRQARDVRQVIAAFGRHPHRNAVLGRTSTPDEQAYITKGRFPHLRAFRG